MLTAESLFNSSITPRFCLRSGRLLVPAIKSGRHFRRKLIRFQLGSPIESLLHGDECLKALIRVSPLLFDSQGKLRSLIKPNSVQPIIGIIAVFAGMNFEAAASSTSDRLRW